MTIQIEIIKLEFRLQSVSLLRPILGIGSVAVICEAFRWETAGVARGGGRLGSVGLCEKPLPDHTLK